MTALACNSVHAQTGSSSSPDPQRVPARLGFSGYVVAGIGEYIVWVEQGSPAERMGLEPGDMILTLNGESLTTEGAWASAIAQAARREGRITLSVRRSRTGNVCEQTCRVFLPA
ncbi:MAG: PDZ domain-containing protein [Planctomycetota bacterium]